MNKGERKLTMLTCYDFQTARILNECGVDMILVGDSLGMVVLGYKDTKSVRLDDMIRHGSAVRKGAPDSFVIVDMPIGTYSLENARKIVDETGCDAVKVEGRSDFVRELVNEGFKVVGHTGLKPQEAEKYRVVRDDWVLNEARELEDAGAMCVVLECVPAELAKRITSELKVPTIGIGAGVKCDGQVLVINDMIGLGDFKGKFVRKYGNVGEVIKKAVDAFKEDVLKGEFPGESESF